MTPSQQHLEAAIRHTALFDAEAPRYDAAYDQPTTPGGYALRTRLDAVLRALDRSPGEVLDVGTGPGRLCAELAGRGWTISGIDRSSEMIARARARVPAAAHRLLEGDLRRLPFADGSFDAVVASGVLEYVPERAAALTELARVLRSGGTAALTMPNPLALQATWRRVFVYPASRAVKRLLPGSRPAPARRRRPPRPRVFRRMLEAAGLRVESLVYTNYLVLPWPLDGLLPRTAVRVARRLEGRLPRLAWLVATQVVVTARKPDPEIDGAAVQARQSPPA